jgi:hypothetical protein
LATACAIPGTCSRNRLDLGQLDAVAPDLDLRVDAAVVLDLAVVVDPAEIPGPVDPARRVALDPDEVSDERPVGEVVAVDVTARQSNPGDADLADLAGRQCPRLARLEDDHAVGRQWHADGHRLVGVDPCPRRGDRGLRRAVDVEEPATGLVPPGDELLWARLAGHQQEAEAGQVLVEGREERGHAAQRGHTPRLEELPQLVAEKAGPARLGHQGGARDPRHPDLLDGKVEGDRHALVDVVPRLDAVDLGRDADEVADAGVLDRHALGADPSSPTCR